MSLPIFIVCHDNGWMVYDTVKALSGRFAKTRLVVVDEASTAPRTIQILRELENLKGVSVHRHRRNVGPKRVRRFPRYWLTRRRPFVLTDPDLDLSTLPADTLEVLRAVADDQGVRSASPAVKRCAPCRGTRATFAPSTNGTTWTISRGFPRTAAGRRS